MREYILTEKEREAIRKFLEDHVPNDYIHLLRHRAKLHLESLRKDIELLEAILAS